MDVSSLDIPIEDFFELMCKNGEIGCWVSDIKNNSGWWSDGYYNMLGIEDKKETLTIENFLDQIIHPDDRHLAAASLKKYLYNHATFDSYDARLQDRQGLITWYHIFSQARYDEQDKIAYIFGGIININNKKKYEEESEKLKFIVDVAEEMMGMGTFERNFITQKIYWSKTVYDILELPYDVPLTDIRREDFYSDRDAQIVFRAIAELRNESKPVDVEVRILTAKKNTLWVRAMAKPVLDEQNRTVAMRGTIQKIEAQKLKENFLIDIRNRIHEQKFFLDETSSMSDVGGWELNLEDQALYWSEQTKKIHEVAEGYVPSFDKAMLFYLPSSQTNLTKHLKRLVDKGEQYDLELELITEGRQKIWIRAIGKPVYELGKIKKVRGVIQNITRQKGRELELSSALKIIDDQNKKLKDFTYIVSHNLYSHVGNLKMITDMVELETDLEVKLEWINSIKNVSAALNETVNNLNGLVSLNTEVKHQLSFAQTLAAISNSINYKLIAEEVKIISNFSACEMVDYVPAYLENIMLNLITNAIKYKHPDRKAIIYLQTLTKDNRILMRITDNGLGIDLEQYGDRLFKMNQTFHQNADARGIGLYITKNQVENMGGTIEVESIVNEGTTFTVHF